MHHNAPASYEKHRSIDAASTSSRITAGRAAQTGTSDVDRLEALKRRIIEWFNARPREAHPEHYFMSDLKRLLCATPREQQPRPADRK